MDSLRSETIITMYITDIHFDVNYFKAVNDLSMVQQWKIK